MSNNVVFNENNIINNSNNKLRYDLHSDLELQENDTVALSGLHMYYSWYNISVRNQNTFFQYKWFNNVDGELTDIFDVNIEPGNYTIHTLNEVLQQKMVKNGHYLETHSNQYIYFLEILPNSTYYKSEIRLSTISETYDFGSGSSTTETLENYIKMPSTWKIPETFKSPELIFPINSNFNDILGFDKNQTISIPEDQQNTQFQYSTLSTKIPNLMPSSSYLVTCNLVDNQLSIPNNVLYSFTLSNQTAFGGSISPQNELIYCKVKPGVYRHITLEILDQKYEPLQILDTNMLIQLSIIKNQNSND